MVSDGADTGRSYRPTVRIGGGFTLVDDHGERVSDQTYRGRHALLFFGFTHCRVVCPDMLRRISAALDAIGPLADNIRPLYITVDPDRDTPEAMRQFLQDRFPRFTGLTGDKEEIEAIKRAYKVYAEKEIADENGEYDIPHSAMIFIIDPLGNYLTHFSDGITPHELAKGLSAILTPR